MKVYIKKYSDEFNNKNNYTINFTINKNIVLLTINYNDENVYLGSIERQNDSFNFTFDHTESANIMKKNDGLINFIKRCIEDYYFIQDLYFPRIYLNTARALADTKQWKKLENEFEIETDYKKIELIQYTMTSLLSGTAILSYASIESFANESLIKIVGLEEYLKIDSDKNTKPLKEKLKLFCKVSNIKSIVYNSIWQDFIILDEIRNLFTHYKQDNLYDIFYKYNEKISPGFLLNTAINTIKYYFDESKLTYNDYLMGNLFCFSDIEVFY